MYYIFCFKKKISLGIEQRFSSFIMHKIDFGSSLKCRVLDSIPRNPHFLDPDDSDASGF